MGNKSPTTKLLQSASGTAAAQAMEHGRMAPPAGTSIPVRFLKMVLFPEPLGPYKVATMTGDFKRLLELNLA
jgi:hypothetical protein